MARKIRFAFVSIVVGAILAIGGAVSGALAAEKVSFFLDWVPYGKHASFYAGVKYGIYKKYGLDVTIQPGKGSGLSVKTIGAKGADYGHADMGTLIIGRANNPDLKVKEIAMIHHDNLFVVAYRKDSGIKTPKDLEGKKIGSAHQNSSKIVFPALAPFTGMDPSKVNWVIMEASAQEPSLFANRVHAIVSYRTRNPSTDIGAKKHGVPIAYFNYSDFGVNIYSNGIIAHEDTLKERPIRTRLFVVASMDAFKWSVKNTTKAIEAFIEKSPSVSRKQARGHWEIGVDVAITKETKRTGIGFMIREKVQQTIDTIFKYRKLKRKPAVDEIYTNDFVAVFPTRM
ncbi:MAG: ABC transporter substrate-binding protein [Nitrospinota bacterium]|jgi:NitT/TauT family transport system substrate-binding protein|nr:ABC transporter substrate-binding protein [Nitrospinota bacterium]